MIVRSDRGTETGIVLCDATPQALAQIRNPTQGQVLRGMSPADGVELSRILAQQLTEFQTAKRLIAASGLDMELVDVERLFGGERVVIYYLSENRIDFRELVKQLAGELQTRIEMKQIGSRDEAKLLADYGDCGKPVCCNTHLSEMPPVSMKMAKLQKATLDPTKISGRCGRLKCCLRYEYDTYEALQKDLPAIGADVITQRGRCRVLAQEILSQHLLVETEDHRRVMIPATEVLTVLKRGDPPPTPAEHRTPRRRAGISREEIHRDKTNLRGHRPATRAAANVAAASNANVPPRKNVGPMAEDGIHRAAASADRTTRGAGQRDRRPERDAPANETPASETPPVDHPTPNPPSGESPPSDTGFGAGL
ncbi:MAG: regulatory iron-sulfur-containing complex subunit RicT [Pirellulales bacterium]